jgi:hypothetical protein
MHWCRAFLVPRQVDVHTPSTVRAKELQQLYTGLKLPQLSLDERLDVLLHVKWMVKEFDCSLTREIVSLIEREADLLNRYDCEVWFQAIWGGCILAGDWQGCLLAG